MSQDKASETFLASQPLAIRLTWPLGGHLLLKGGWARRAGGSPPEKGLKLWARGIRTKPHRTGSASSSVNTCGSQTLLCSKITRRRFLIHRILSPSLRLLESEFPGGSAQTLHFKQVPRDCDIPHSLSVPHLRPFLNAAVTRKSLELCPTKMRAQAHLSQACAFLSGGH